MNKTTIFLTIFSLGILFTDYFDGRGCKEKGKVHYISSGEFTCAPTGDTRGYLK